MKAEQIQQANRELQSRIHHPEPSINMLAQYCKDFDEALLLEMHSNDPKVMNVCKLQKEFIDAIFRYVNVERNVQ